MFSKLTGSEWVTIIIVFCFCLFMNWMHSAVLDNQLLQAKYENQKAAANLYKAMYESTQQEAQIIEEMEKCLPEPVMPKL